MATLADSFLADFESSGEEEEEQNFDDEEQKDEDEDDDFEDVEIQDIDFDELEEKEDYDDSPAALAPLLKDEEFEEHLEEIEDLQAKTENEFGVHVGVNKEKEYNVIISSNEYITTIDDQIAIVHKYVRDLYAIKYSELEQLVQTPVEYAKVVKVIGNETDLTLVEQDLSGIVPNATILTISVTATTTIGQPLPDADLKKVFQGCDVIIKLDECKQKLFHYIETRMQFIAPNLSTIIGSNITARIIGAAGGLAQLVKIPSCNLQVIGANSKKALSGYSRANANLHIGLLGQTDIIQGTPKELKNRAMRLLAGKCTLAARTDLLGQDKKGTLGQKFYELITAKIAKWQEPPPPKLVKALPKPLPPKRRKRSGKRFRKQKDKYKVTEAQKLMNRVAFGKKEEINEYTGESYGMLGQAHVGGALVARSKSSKEQKQNLSRKTQARLRRVRTASNSDAQAGTASSIAFTPVQGMELVPQSHRGGPATNRYFSETSSFLKVGDDAPLAKRKKLSTTSWKHASSSSSSSSSSASASSDDV